MFDNLDAYAAIAMMFSLGVTAMLFGFLGWILFFPHKSYIKRDIEPDA
jgi:hypothetical protein